MPANIQHIDHAKHNIRFLEGFYSSYNFNDWAVTVSFYIAVHIIEAAIFTTKQIRIRGQTLTLEHSEQLLQHPNLVPSGNLSYHEARNIIVGQNFPAISGWLKALYNDSRTARYKNYSFDKLKTELLIKSCLKEIIKWYNQSYSGTVQINLN